MTLRFTKSEPNSIAHFGSKVNLVKYAYVGAKQFNKVRPKRLLSEIAYFLI